MRPTKLMLWNWVPFCHSSGQVGASLPEHTISDLFLIKFKVTLLSGYSLGTGRSLYETHPLIPQSFLILQETLSCKPGFLQRHFGTLEPHKTPCARTLLSGEECGVWIRNCLPSRVTALGSLPSPCICLPAQGLQPPRRSPGTQRQVSTQWS